MPLVFKAKDSKLGIEWKSLAFSGTFGRLVWKSTNHLVGDEVDLRSRLKTIAEQIDFILRKYNIFAYQDKLLFDYGQGGAIENAASFLNRRGDHPDYDPSIAAPRLSSTSNIRMAPVLLDDDEAKAIVSDIKGGLSGLFDFEASMILGNSQELMRLSATDYERLGRYNSEGCRMYLEAAARNDAMVASIK